MDNTTNTQPNSTDLSLGHQTGGWQNTNRDVVNPTDKQIGDEPDSELTPLPIDDVNGDLDDDEDGSDLPDMGDNIDDEDPMEDDEIDLPGTDAPEIGDDRGRRIVQEPMMDDAADLPYAPSR